MYCKGTASIHDLRVQLASLADWELPDARARTLFLDVVADVWRSYRGRHLSTDDFIEHLETRLPVILERHGVTVSGSRLTSRLRNWERTWFVRRLATPTPVATGAPKY